MGNDCGTGVAFTRNPSTGEKKLYGEFLMNAQGEDVVAGIRTPSPIDELKNTQPEVYKQFVPKSADNTLKSHYRDMQDMEFTIERGRLFMLQTRNGKRTAAAALQIAVRSCQRGHDLQGRSAHAKIDPQARSTRCCIPTFEPKALKNAKAIASGLPASPGAACGRVYFTAAGCDGSSQARRKSHTRSPRDLSRRHRGYVCLRGHPHRTRRNDVARGGRRPRNGHLLRRRLLRS